MSFKDQAWATRYERMGDTAERKFEEQSTVNYVRWGLQRPPLNMRMLPARVRYAPDYLTSSCFVEAQGFGRDNTLKLKIDKYNALHWWRDVHPVDLFVWDSHRKRSARLSLLALDELVRDGHARIEAFPEGKSYFAIDGESVFDAAQA